MSERLKALQQFRDLVVAEAKANLQRLGKDTSGKLSNSIKGEVKEMPNSIGIYFEMEPYGNFQDKGVSGTQTKYNTPYKYTNKMPPAKAFDKWAVKKGIAPRNVKGQFQSRKGLQFALGYLYSLGQGATRTQAAAIQVVKKAVKIASVLDVNTNPPLQLVVQERIFE